jgi:hypothetical protein
MEEMKKEFYLPFYQIGETKAIEPLLNLDEVFNSTLDSLEPLLAEMGLDYDGFPLIENEVKEEAGGKQKKQKKKKGGGRKK